MSDLLAIRDFDSAEFIDRLAGLFRHCQGLSIKVGNIERIHADRIAGIKRNTFKGLADLGEALLRVQEKRPREYGDWFAAHRDRLGFSERHGDRCKAAAQEVREHGFEAAYELALSAHKAAPPAPALRIPLQGVEKLPEDKARALYAQLLPIFTALRERFA